MKIRYYLDDYLKNPAINARLYDLDDSSTNPICVGVGELTSLKVNNDWENGSSTGALKKVVDAYEGLRREAFSWDTGVINALLDLTSNFNDGKASGVFSNLASSAESFKNKINNSIFKYKLYTSDSYYKIYNGTSVSFGLTFTCTLISDSYKSDVYETMHKLISKSIGDDKYTSKTAVLQEPPNGYETGLGGLDEVSFNPQGIPESHIKGTLFLVLNDGNGIGFRIPNLLIDDLNIETSDTAVKCEKGLRPLWINLNISFTQAQRYNKKMLLDMFK